MPQHRGNQSRIHQKPVGVAVRANSRRVHSNPFAITERQRGNEVRSRKTAFHVATTFIRLPQTSVNVERPKKKASRSTGRRKRNAHQLPVTASTPNARKKIPVALLVDEAPVAAEYLPPFALTAKATWERQRLPATQRQIPRRTRRKPVALLVDEEDDGAVIAINAFEVFNDDQLHQHCRQGVW